MQISGLTIQHGQADEGGGLLNSGGQVTLTSVVVANNLALGSSGAAGLPGTGGTGNLGPGGGSSPAPAVRVPTGAMRWAAASSTRPGR